MPNPSERARLVEQPGATRWSLRRRVIWLTVSVTAVAWVLGAIAIALVQNRISENLFDQRLKDIAGALLTFADHEISELQEAGGDVVHFEGAATLGLRYKYQIWSNDGQLLLISVDTPRQPFVPQTGNGFTNTEIGGVPMRILVLPTPDGRKRLEVAEPLSARSAPPNPELYTLAIPMALTLLLLIGAGSFMARHVTRALSDSAGEVTQRGPDDLRALVVTDPPAELVPILAAINVLFRRIESAIASERRFVSAAAHELRSPLAAIKLQAQVALLTKDEADRRNSLNYLIQAIDSASHMIDQLLTMSRIDGMVALQSQKSLLQLDSIAAHLIDEMRPLAARREQTIEDRLEAADIDGLEFGVAVLLRNLIDNASRYSPRGRRILVSTGTDAAGTPFMQVDDEGPGIPPEERQRVFERFTRLANETNADGCGIGLSIVQAVVELHRARVELTESPMGGLRVHVCFPPSLLGEDVGSISLQLADA